MQDASSLKRRPPADYSREMSMSWNHGGGEEFEFELDVNYDFEASVELDFNTEVDYDSDTDIDAEVDVCVDIEGNLAEFNVDVQAIGDDSATQVNLVAITTDEYSSISLNGYSAVA